MNPHFWNRMNRLKDNSMNYIPSSIHYSENENTPEDLSKPIINFEPGELDQLDEIAERVITTFAEKKEKMHNSIQTSYQKIKKKFTTFLDKCFEEVYDLVNHHSKYNYFEQFVSRFQDAKSDYEMEETEESRTKLVDSLKNLFNLEDLLAFQNLVHSESLEKMLIDLESDYFHKLLNPSLLRGVFTKTQKLLNLQKTDEQCLLSSIKLKNEGVFKEKNEFNLNTFLKHEKLVQKLQNKITPNPVKGIDQNLVYTKEIEFMLNLLNKKEDFTDCKFEDCFYLFKSMFLFQKKLCEFDKDTNQFQIALVRVTNEFNILDSLNIKKKVFSYACSPCKKYLIINMIDNESLVFNIKDKKLRSLDNNSKKQMKGAIFVNSKTGLLLAYKDSYHFLKIFNLETNEKFFNICKEKIKSIHYIDSTNVMLITENLRFGLLSTTSMSIINFVTLTNFGNPSFKPKDSKLPYTMNSIGFNKKQNQQLFYTRKEEKKVDQNPFIKIFGKTKIYNLFAREDKKKKTLMINISFSSEKNYFYFFKFEKELNEKYKKLSVIPNQKIILLEIPLVIIEKKFFSVSNISKKYNFCSGNIYLITPVDSKFDTIEMKGVMICSKMKLNLSITSVQPSWKLRCLYDDWKMLMLKKKTFWEFL